MLSSGERAARDGDPLVAASVEHAGRHGLALHVRSSTRATPGTTVDAVFDLGRARVARAAAAGGVE